MSTRLRLSVPVTIALLCASSAPLLAQTSTTRGWSLGAHFNGGSLKVEDGDAATGGGGGIRAGYGINRIVTFFLQIDGTTFAVDDAASADVVEGDWTMGHFDLGARFHFANALRRWIPYLEAAVGGRVVSLKDAGDTDVDVDFNGGAFTVGGGLAIYLKQTLALDTNLKFTGGQFTDVKIGSVTVGGLDIDASSVRFGLGVTWWP